MKYGSVCSGIEAASKAWEPLGWKPAWFSEIEPFPSAVLAHHWPEVTNLGDMTKIADAVRAGDVEAPDVLVGGTPCQAFSIAGLREGLSDDRGKLTLSYVELANAIDAKRRERGEPDQSSSGKTSPACSAAKTMPSGAFWQDLPEKAVSCSQQGENGRTQVVCLDQKGLSPGASLMLNFSEWPNDAAVCSLSQVLEKDSIPQRYFLSSTACAGILRRAENRNRKLPEMLENALKSVVTGITQQTLTQP